MGLASRRRFQQTRTLCRGYRLTPMANDISHLTADAAYWLGENDERRVRAIQARRWVLYLRAK